MSKSIIIKCRITPEENEMLKKQSKGFNFSKFIRAKLLDIPIVIGSIKSVTQKPGKVKIYKNTDEALAKDFKPNSKTVKKAEASYRRFAEPGALLKK